MNKSVEVNVVGIVGAGAMGAGIAQNALTAGLRVILFDADAGTLNSARDQIKARIERMVEKERTTAEILASVDQRLVLAQSLTDLSSAQVIIEAIIERLEPKQELFAELESIVDSSVVLATNTSSLSVAAIARDCEYRDRVCGLHFFNPVPLMKLVEVIGTPDTSEQTYAVAMTLSELLEKTAVKVKDVPGFLVNLLGRAYVTEALHIRHENVATESLIDELMREVAGFRMGPFELMDLTGIDVNLPATQYIYQGFQYDPRLKTTILHQSMLNAGRLGRKSGQGFHDYSNQTQAAKIDNGDELGELGELGVYATEAHPDFDLLQADGLEMVASKDADVVLIRPDGEDASSYCARNNLESKNVVAMDCFAIETKILTLMAPPGGNGVIEKLATKLRQLGYKVFIINDSPGFIVPRILSMVANLGCEVAQIGVAEAPEDIDTAMKLAQNYPRGPLEWASYIGPDRVFEILQKIHQITGSDRYRPSLWLRRRAMLKLPIHTPD